MSSSSTNMTINDNEKKTVVFATYSSQYSIIHINDYTDDEISSTWYTSEELKQIKAQAKSTINKVIKGIPIEPTKDCIQGLETYTTEGQRVKYQQRLDAMDAVLDEQEIQREEGYTNVDAIADSYYSVTYYSQVAAHGRGLQYHAESILSTTIGPQLLSMYNTKQQSYKQQQMKRSSCASNCATGRANSMNADGYRRQVHSATAA